MKCCIMQHFIRIHTVCQRTCRMVFGLERVNTNISQFPFRYKILSVITIGQKKDQGVRVGSRFLWDADRDSFCAVDWSNKHLYAVGTVYAVYYE